MSRPKNSTRVGIPASCAAAATLAAGSTPEHRHAALLEVLEEVAVVARDLDDLARGVETEALDHLLRIRTCMAEPALGVGREVRVVAEHLCGRHDLRELNKEAALTDVDAQRVERLGLLELRLGQVGVGQRGAPKVREDVAEPLAA